MDRGRLEASLSREGARGHRSASKTTRLTNSLSYMGTEAQGMKGPTEKQPAGEEERSLSRNILDAELGLGATPRVSFPHPRLV